VVKWILAKKTSRVVHASNVLNNSLRFRNDDSISNLEVRESSTNALRSFFRNDNFNVSSRNVCYHLDHLGESIISFRHKELCFLFLAINFKLKLSATIYLELSRVPSLFVELFIHFCLRGHQVLEIIVKLIYSHFTESLVLAGSDIYGSILCLILSCDKDEVPLLELMVSNLLVESKIRVVNFNLVTLSMQI